MVVYDALPRAQPPRFGLTESPSQFDRLVQAGTTGPERENKRAFLPRDPFFGEVENPVFFRRKFEGRVPNQKRRVACAQHCGKVRRVRHKDSFETQSEFEQQANERDGRSRRGVQRERSKFSLVARPDHKYAADLVHCRNRDSGNNLKVRYSLVFDARYQSDIGFACGELFRAAGRRRQNHFVFSFERPMEKGPTQGSRVQVVYQGDPYLQHHAPSARVPANSAISRE